jgi:hypothetical protein
MQPSAERKLMQAKGFFSSLFDYSFSSFITPRIIRILYILSTIVVALWTLLFILLAFKSSTGLGIIALVIGGPIFFVIAMIYVRVGLELIMVFFRIHGDVDEINQRAGGTAGTPVTPVPLPPAPEPAAATPAPEPVARYCENCGAERRPGQGFCTACGAAA